MPEKRLRRFDDDHDFPLDFHWKTKPEFVSRAGVSLTGNRKAVMAISSIMTSLVLAAAAQAGGWVSYSRNKDFYYAGQARYEGTAFTYDRILAAVGELKKLGLIEEERAAQCPGGSGWQSRIRATDKLVYAFQGAEFEPVIHSVLRMKDDAGRLVDFTETQATRRMTKVVEARNEALRPIRITLPVGDGWEHRGGHVLARSEKEGGGWALVRPTPYPFVIRSFSRGSWKCHGRLYGWWQLLPAARRAEMLINGDAVVEHDYSCLHGTLLYAKVGLRPDGDLYAVPGLKNLRKACKGALNSGINAASLPETVWSLLGKEEKKPGSWPHSYRETVRIVQGVYARNEAIRQFIGSDAGIGLMKVDSDMAIEVLKRCEKKGIPVLPVHDSYISMKGHGDAVRGIMDEVLEETCNALSPSGRNVIGQIPLQVEGEAPPQSAGPVVSSLSEAVASSLAEPVGTLPPEAVGVSPAVVETPVPEAVVVPFRPVLWVAPPRPATSRPSGVRSLPVAVGVSPPPSETPPCPVVPSVPVAPPSAGPGLPAFLRALLPPVAPEPSPVPSAAPVPPSRLGSALAGLRSSLAPAEVVPDGVSPSPPPRVAPVAVVAAATLSAPVPASLAPAAPAPSLSAPRPPEPLTKQERVSLLRSLADRAGAMRTPEEREEADRRMAELKAMARRHRRVA